MRRPLRPVRVRAAAVVLALLAHALVLLLFASRGRAPMPAAAWSLQFVSIWPPDQPPPEVIAPAPLPMRARRTTPPAPATTVVIPNDTEAPPSPEHAEAPSPKIDWYGEARKAAARGAAKANESSTFSPPPKVIQQACKPKKHSFEWNPEPKKAGLLPLPFVVLGNCVVGLGFFTCNLSGPPEANGHLFDDLKKGDRPVSSVPDPHTCE
jgi:hypothetical protein